MNHSFDTKIEAKINVTDILAGLWPIWIAQLIALVVTSLLIKFMTKDFSNEIHSIIGYYIWIVIALLLNYIFFQSSRAYLNKFSRQRKKTKK